MASGHGMPPALSNKMWKQWLMFSTVPRVVMASQCSRSGSRACESPSSVACRSVVPLSEFWLSGGVHQ